MTADDRTAPAVDRQSAPYAADERACCRVSWTSSGRRCAGSAPGSPTVSLRRARSAVVHVAAGPGPSHGRRRTLVVPLPVHRRGHRPAVRAVGEPQRRTSTELDDTPAAEVLLAHAQEAAAAMRPWQDTRSTRTFARRRRRSDLSLRWVYLHMIEEYARHNGHADLLRERIDGSTGE